MSFELLLENISKHTSLTGEEITYFSSLLQTTSLKPGAFLLREGEVCRCTGFVTKGCLKTYSTGENGSDHITDFLIEEWWADDLYSFFTGKASTSNISAIEASEVLQISKPDLELLYQAIPKFERFFRLLFQNAYIAQKEQIHSLLWVPAEERYRSFLKQKPYAEKRFAQKDIAAYLGVTPQFLSTLKKKMQQVKAD